jgi:hypothetical protein
VLAVVSGALLLYIWRGCCQLGTHTLLQLLLLLLVLVLVLAVIVQLRLIQRGKGMNSLQSHNAVSVASVAVQLQQLRTLEAATPLANVNCTHTLSLLLPQRGLELNCYPRASNNCCLIDLNSAVTVPLDAVLAAALNLASMARMNAATSHDLRAELMYLLEALQAATTAEQLAATGRG